MSPNYYCSNQWWWLKDTQAFKYFVAKFNHFRFAPNNPKRRKKKTKKRQKKKKQKNKQRYSNPTKKYW